jgi:hypothetical protein
MIEFTHETTRYKVKPENAQRIRADLAKPKKYTCIAHKAVKRGFPVFAAGMSTADYVRQFNGQFVGVYVTLAHDCPNYNRPAPMLDATQPEVWEDLEYIPTMDDLVPLPVKAKKLTTRAALVALIEACEEGDPEQIAAAVIRARGAL